MSSSFALLLVALVALVLAIAPASAAFTWYDLSKYDHFVKRPTNGIRTGGRLTTRQIQYIRAAGYNSYISTVNFTTTDDSFNGVPGPFPSTNDEMTFAASLGFETFAVNAQFTSEYVEIISDAIQKMKKPVFIHCHVGFSATLFTTLHLYRVGALVDSNILPWALSLGWDYQANSVSLGLINDYTGMNAPLTNASIELTLTSQEQSYKNYYWPHRLNSDNWYNLGQVLDTQVQTIHDQGYKVVISMRANGEPTIRLASDATTGAIDNNEFSDSNGNYDVELERSAFEAIGVKFVHLPVTGSTAWTSEQFWEYFPTLQSLETQGPVLAHCASGYRSAGYISTYLAYVNHQCTAWALHTASQVGYSFDINSADAQVVAFMQSVLKC